MTNLGRFVLAPLLAFIALASWAVASPIGASPDDGYHLASIWCGLGEREGICELGTAEDEKMVPANTVGSAACFAHFPGQSAACQSASQELVSTSDGNFAGSYPPIFYGTMSLLVVDSVAVSVVLMRLLNAAIFVTVLTLLVNLLPRGRRAPVLLGIIVGMVPLGVFLVSSVNPSSWALLATSTVWLVVARFFQSTRSSERVWLAAFAVVLAVMGAGSRGDAAAFVAFSAVIGSILTYENTRAWWVRASLPFGIVLIGAGFFLTSGQTTGGAAPELGPLTGERILENLTLNVPLLPSLWVGNFGADGWGLGWLDTSLPPLVWVTMLAVVAASSFAGIRMMSRRKALAILLTVLSLVVVPMYMVVRDQVIIGQYIQPRYVLPLVLLFLGLVWWGHQSDMGDLTRPQLALLFIGMAVANAAALHTNLRRYLTGVDVLDLNLNAGPEWWWGGIVSPMLVWGTGSIAAAAYLVLCYAHLVKRPGKLNAAEEPNSVDCLRSTGAS